MLNVVVGETNRPRFIVKDNMELIARDVWLLSGYPRDWSMSICWATC